MKNPNPNRFHKEEYFRCAACGEVFKKGWSEKEARAELARQAEFQGVHDSELVLICDDCDKEMQAQGLFRRPSKNGQT